jgi:uncharacterized protein YdhG (YjbR/CyaY superfamily)
VKGPVVTTIDEYLAPLDPEQRAALEQLRRDIKTLVPAATECISYQLPGFRLDGRAFVWFGAAKKHNALYGPVPREGFEAELAQYQTGKGTIRFPRDQSLPVELLRRLLEVRVAELARQGSAARPAKGEG